MNKTLRPMASIKNHAPVASRFPWRMQRFLGVALLLVCAFILMTSEYPYAWRQAPGTRFAKHDIASFQHCSINNFLGTGLPFLDSASPPPVDEFVQRRDNLAKALIADQVDAFIVEPGYTFQYYANISQKDWEAWEPEERPFLMIVQSHRNSTTGEIHALTRFLVPSFEVERVKLLNMPFEETLDIVPWEEHWNPYQTLKTSWKTYPITEMDIRSRLKTPRVMVDEEMRDFLQRGLNENGFDVVGLGGEVQRVRQSKSPREIEILRAVNTGTIEAVRSMRECMYAGLTENEVIEVLDNTLQAAGLEPFFDIVLFGEVNVTLRAGMVFTSEPGVYLVEKFGVRHEDVLLVTEDGEPDFLSGRRARGPWDP